MEDGLRMGKILDYNKLQFLIKQNPLKNIRRKLFQVPNRNGRVSTKLNFVRSKRRYRKEMRDQVPKPLTETLLDLLPKLQVANLIAKMA